VHRQGMRNAWLDVTTIVPATSYHRRSYAERYRRFTAQSRQRRLVPATLSLPHGGGLLVSRHTSLPGLWGALKVILRHEHARRDRLSRTPITPCGARVILRIDAKQGHGHRALTLAPPRMHGALLLPACTLHGLASSVCL
jgi:hypothetical protein